MILALKIISTLVLTYIELFNLFYMIDCIEKIDKLKWLGSFILVLIPLITIWIG